MSGGARSLVCGGIIVVTAILVSCAGSQTRRARFIGSHPSLPPLTKNAVINGGIVPGMSAAEVRASWGEPDNRMRELAPGGEYIDRWLYPKPYGGHINIYEVKFVDGRVRVVTSRASRRAQRALPPPPPGSLSLGTEIPHDVINARRYLELGRKLRLSAGQVQALEGIRSAYRAEYEQKRDFIGLYRTELSRLTRSVNPDTVLIQEKLDDIARLQSDLRGLLVRAMQDAANILTPPQRQLLDDASALFPPQREQR
ncbi:MAG: hypothetical protein ACYC5N_05910 [Endomicrobiales bacterium]